MSEMVERVARVIYAKLAAHTYPLLQTHAADAFDRESDPRKEQMREWARAAIEAMRTPTEAMVSAMIGPHNVGLDLEQATQRLQVCVWNAGIDAALSQPKGGEVDG